MLPLYHIHSQPKHLEHTASMMHKSLLPIVPACPILPTSSQPIPANDLSDTWSSTNTGAHSKWSPPAVKSQPPRDSARQILRHRSFSFQEFSQRYADPTAELDEAFVLREARFQDTKNRQNSVDFDMSDETQKLLAYEWERAQKRVLYAVKKEYKWAIDNGIAKEQARAVLPEGLTVSRMYMNGTLRSWIHYIELRASNGTQKEHMDIARACAQAITAIFPMTSTLVA